MLEDHPTLIYNAYAKAYPDITWKSTRQVIGLNVVLKNKHIGKLKTRAPKQESMSMEYFYLSLSLDSLKTMIP